MIVSVYSSRAVCHEGMEQQSVLVKDLRYNNFEGQCEIPIFFLLQL